jgi:hypothetical protein
MRSARPNRSTPQPVALREITGTPAPSTLTLA